MYEVVTHKMHKIRIEILNYWATTKNEVPGHLHSTTLSFRPLSMAHEQPSCLVGTIL